MNSNIKYLGELIFRQSMNVTDEEDVLRNSVVQRLSKRDQSILYEDE